MRTSDDLSSATLMAVRAIGSVCWGDQSEAWGFGRGARCVDRGRGRVHIDVESSREVLTGEAEVLTRRPRRQRGGPRLH